jgi:alkylation response protein AidB-like acyl-CoA dehydrogenase
LLDDEADLALGSIVLPGYGEASPGLQGLHAQARVERRGEELVLTSSSARPVAASRDARVFGVVCELGDRPALVLVPADAPGVRLGEAVAKTGLAASRNGEVAFDAVTLPSSFLVFEGAQPCRELVAWLDLGCAAAASGALLAGWEILREWGETRVIKGKGQVLRDNPLVASLLGEITQKIVTSRLLLLDLARLLSRADAVASGALLATAAAVARSVTRAAEEGLDASMELMGSAGYATEWNIERCWRDAKTIRTIRLPEAQVLTDLARHAFGAEVVREGRKEP